MMNKPDISSEENLHRWLLVATLLFGFFSFSGFIGNAPHQRPQVFSTELVVKTHIVVKRATFFDGTFRKFHAIGLSAIFPKFEIKYVLIAHNLLGKTRLDRISAHIFTFGKSQKFFRIRKVSESSEENHPHLFRG